MRSIIWFAYFWISLVFLQPWLPYLKYLEKKGDIAKKDRITQRVVHNWASRLLWLAGAKIQVDGLENLPADDVAAVYVSNHQSYFDIPLVLTRLGAPKGLVAKKELAKLPFVANWMEQLRCIFLDRENPREAMKAINTAIENVSKGYPIVIFPEGTRSKDGVVGEFKAGAFRIAEKNKAPIVPFFLDNTYGLLEKNGRFSIKPATVRMVILPMINCSDYTKEQYKALPELVKNQIEEAIRIDRENREK